jgi:hypothetical protein
LETKIRLEKKLGLGKKLRLAKKLRLGKNRPEKKLWLEKKIRLEKNANELGLTKRSEKKSGWGKNSSWKKKLRKKTPKNQVEKKVMFANLMNGKKIVIKKLS